MSDAAQRLFFSYARKDSEFVLKLALALRNEGRRVWVDQLDIPTGARWDMEVEKALKDCTRMLVALSPASIQSQNVLDEVGFALDEKKDVLPLLLQPVNIPFRLKRLQYIDFTGDFDSAYRRLVAALVAPGAASDPVSAHEPPREDPVPPPRPPDMNQRPAPLAADARTVAAPAQRNATTAGRPFPKWIVASIVLVGLLVVIYAVVGNRSEPQPTEASSSVTAPSNQTEVAAAPNPTPATAAKDVAKDAEAAARQAADYAEAAKAKPQPDASLVTDAQAKRFVDQYLGAQNRASAPDLLRFYADRVDYYDQKGIDKEFILKDKQNYYRRWPEVDNRLASAIDVEALKTEGTVKVTYTINYRVANPTRADSKAGVARETLYLRLENGGLAIYEQREQVLSTQN